MVVLRARVAAGRLGGASRRGGIGVALSTTATKSWVPDDARSLEKAAMTSVLHDFTQSQLRKAEKMVPWFLSQMPAAYFRLVSDEERLSHLQATAGLFDEKTGELSGDESMEFRIVSQAPGGRKSVTYARVGDRPGTL